MQEYGRIQVSENLTVYSAVFSHILCGITDFVDTCQIMLYSVTKRNICIIPISELGGCSTKVNPWHQCLKLYIKYISAIYKISYFSMVSTPHPPPKKTKQKQKKQKKDLSPTNKYK